MKKSIGAQALAFLSPVWIVGTYDHEAKPNVMAVAWGGICCSAPPCLSISIQKVRYSYQSIIERKVFTVSVPSEEYAKEADYFGIASGKNVDKFSHTGLTPVRAELIEAPYVKEFPLVIECKVIQALDLGSHTQFIGQIMDVKAEDSVLGENELPLVEKVKPIVVGAKIWTYHGIGKYLGQAFSMGREL